MKKKNLFVLALLGALFTTVAQVSDPEISTLLGRLELLDRSSNMDTSDVFSSEERQRISDYFSQNIDTSPVKAPEDVYGLQIRFVCNEAFGFFPLSGPYNFSVINATATTILGGDMDDSGTLYGVDDDLRTLVTIDTSSGTEATVATITGLPGDHDITGLAWNSVNSTMYACSTNDLETRIYSLDLGSGALNELGLTGTETGIWLAIDDDGNAFMADIGDDSLHSINLTTGAATLIGPFGVDINFGQDADFDASTGILYMAAYLGSGVNIFGTVDTGTGALSTLGSVDNNCSELGIIAIEASTLGVETPLNELISVFPNPASDILRVRVPSAITVERVSLYDILGKNTGSTLVNGEINVSQLARGVYLLNVNTDSGTLTQKIVKQ